MAGGPPRMGGGPMGGPPGGSDMMRERLSRFEGFLRSMDTNGNGMLEISEVPEDRRRFFSFMAERAGLDPNQPIAISGAMETIQRRFFGGESGGSRGAADRDREHDRRSDSQSSSTDDSKNEKPAVSLVPGFGVPEGFPPIPGFGAPSLALAATANTSNSRSDSRSRSDDAEREERARRFADMIMGRYDANRNGRLERDEWRDMRGDPQEMDRNHDGVITREELVQRVAEFSRSSDRWRAGDRSSRSSRGESPKEQTGKRLRFLRPTERLPDDLPDWFYDRDKNEDGQIAMAEFASSWSDSRVQEFLRFDLNSDGVITPDECLKAEEQAENEAEQPARAAETSAQAGSTSSNSDSEGGGRPRLRFNWGGMMFGGR